MVADMNITGVTQAQATPPDTPKQKETDVADGSFAAALENSQTDSEKSLEKDSEVKQNTTQKKASTTNANANDKKLDSDSESTAQETPNPLTTKPNKPKTESELVKALKAKTDDAQDIQTEGGAKDKVKKAESAAKDSKTDLSTQAALLQDTSKSVGQSLDTTGKTAEKDLEVASSADSKKSMESKSSMEAQKELQKSLNDVKKEAQARNLNLQKIEIMENGKKSTINPEDLMDSGTLGSNKEKLSLALQDKGQALSTSLAKMSNQDSDLNAKKDALLAELLNRYDANANAKRKAQNEMEKLQFKVGDGDKSMVVERTVIQPKNITESKFRNEVMEQEFLEELHNITGDSELGELVDTNRAKIMAQVAQQGTLGNAKDSAIKKTYQGWAQQGQFLDPKEIKDSKNVAFEMEVQKPFDAMLSENLKADSKVKEAEATSTTEKKTDDKKKEQVESKQETGAIHTKQEVSMKNAMAREAIRNFASQFREEILNYKPPITRINLELNPASLGQVSMTVSKRGKDLQVSITSNSNVMTMFVQNAQELRQNLMQIGFNNLDLNFSANDGKGSNAQQDDSKEQQGENAKLQSIEEAETQTQLGNVPKSLEISLPQYA